MIRLSKSILVFLALVFSFASVADFQVPSLTSPVMDEANLIEPGKANEMRAVLRQLWQTEQTQVQVLTIPSLDGVPIEQASIEIVDQWKLGSAEADKGLLLLVSKADRRVRIEVGQGLEGDLTDAHSKRIIDQVIVPLFKKGDTTSGILLGVSEIIAKTNPNFPFRDMLNTGSVRPQQKVKRERSLGAKIFQGLMLLLMLFFFIRNPLLFLAIMAGGGRGGRGGGGGWSGGGGGFSGGGASGGW